ncbi:type II toxin-antitoxin system HicB family antitoxin [Sphingomonas faeni]|uniref:type II toxin-antitoxin system HicB family antitoxin n=1 Tax=Sphingomonas faeni TaxID=185950 RepID=UPI003364CC34
MMQPHYHINVFWYPNDECWVADIPDLKACSAFGDTPEEAVAEVRMAMAGWIETARDNGLEIPVPAYRPDPYAIARAA